MIDKRERREDGVRLEEKNYSPSRATVAPNPHHVPPVCVINIIITWFDLISAVCSVCIGQGCACLARSGNRSLLKVYSTNDIHFRLHS